VTALHLNRLGIDAVVFEATSEVRALGVGINLLPHAVRELTILGLADPIAAAAVATGELVYFNKFGAEIWREPRGVAAGYKWPQYSIHRGRFQMILLDEVVARIGADRVLTGRHLESFEEDGNGVTARFIDKATGAVAGVYRGDILIGADGIHSVVRHKYYPHEQQPEYSGRVLWRATTEAPAFLTGRSMIMAGHPDRKFVAYPIFRRVA
jgi:5-methylphenazine-1-carboxylate 1-monooxygenase